MNTFFGSVALVLMILMVPMIYRIISGPTVIDRMIGLNVIGAKTTILLLLIGIMSDQISMFVDLALTYSLLNFISSLACARFIQRRRSLVPDLLGLAADQKEYNR
ncbi:MAG: pH regulation protein F [Candidatus Dadabacteria bacterium]|nr:MAG: pH regulation protein F [Candidatus Dadabacteria bacterium]